MKVYLNNFWKHLTLKYYLKDGWKDFALVFKIERGGMFSDINIMIDLLGIRIFGLIFTWGQDYKDFLFQLFNFSLHIDIKGVSK